jgi:hypothetical protein
MGRGSGPITVFYSYSHKDDKFRAQLDTHLSLLKRRGLLKEWHDRKIVPGVVGDRDRHSRRRRTSSCSWSAPTSSLPTTAGARR